jgi:hypothetical protein
MAVVTDRVVELRGGDVWASVTYDDATGVIASVASHNGTGGPVGRVLVTLASGTVILDQPIPAGDFSRTVPGNRNISTLNIYATA